MAIEIKYIDNRPIITCELFYKNEVKIKTDFLIDSGADASCIPASFSEYILGVKLEDMSKPYLKRIGCDPKSTTCLCGTDIESYRLPLLVGFKEYKFPLNLIWLFDCKQDTQPVLGRDDFFRLFEVTFRENEKKVILKPKIKEINQEFTNFSEERINNYIALLKSRK